MAEYLASQAISRSDLWTIHKRNPYFYRWRKLHGSHETSSAFTYGSAIHEAILEPDRFEGRWGAYDGRRDSRTKAYQDWMADTGIPHERVLTMEEWRMLEATVKRVRSLPGPSYLLEAGMAEQSVFYTDAETGIECKARFDFIDRSRGLGVDLKTTADISTDGLAKSFAQHGYAVQAVHYMEAMAAMSGTSIDWTNPETYPPFFFLCVSKEEPIEVALFQLDSLDLQKAAAIRRSALTTLAECQANDVWPGIPHQIQRLSLPKWWAPEVA